MKDADADCEGNSHQVLHKLATRATTADRAHFLAPCRIKAGVDNGDQRLPAYFIRRAYSSTGLDIALSCTL